VRRAAVDERLGCPVGQLSARAPQSLPKPGTLGERRETTMALTLLTTEDRQTVDTLTADLVRLRTAPPHNRLMGTVVAVYCRWLQSDADRRPSTCRAYISDVMAFADAMAPETVVITGILYKVAVLRINISSRRGMRPDGVLMTRCTSLFFI